MPVQPFQVIVVTEGREKFVTTVRLDRAPDSGDTIELAHGERVIVRHVGGPKDDVAGVIIAGPAG